MGSKRLSLNADAVNEDESTLALTVLLKSCHAPIALLHKEGSGT